jgi:beta-phosphoglucomutase family hydrolase
MDYAALIFDCDGTLADTMPAHYMAWTTTMKRYGIDFTEQRFYALGGVPTKNIVAMLADEAGVALDVDAVAIEKEHAFHEYLHQVGRIDPVVAIAEAHRGKLPMAVATGTERWSVERVLDQIGIRDWFDFIACADEVAAPKPAPDVYLEAARRIGVDPARCCVYEDSDLGLEGARRAGMAAVDVRPMYGKRA